MGFFDDNGSIGDTGGGNGFTPEKKEYSKETLPDGSGYNARVVGRWFDDTKGTVDLRFDITLPNGEEHRKSQRHFLKKKDGGKNIYGIKELQSQLVALGVPSSTLAQIKKGVEDIQGSYVTLKVSTKEGSKYQDFTIISPGARPTDALDSMFDEPEVDASDDDIPF